MSVVPVSGDRPTVVLSRTTAATPHPSTEESA
jgi:hypothetical protein